MRAAKNIYEKLLLDLDTDAMAEYSVLDHHVKGMHYLCLFRDDRVTIKIYLMEKPENPNGGFLVSPHSHRYAFDSTVLYGSLDHIRFTESGNGNGVGDWDKFTYDPDTRTLLFSGRADLCQDMKYKPAGSSYFVNLNEIHTLRLCDDKPVIIGLTQLHDELHSSELYLQPMLRGKPVFSGSRDISPYDLQALRDRCLKILGLVV